MQKIIQQQKVNAHAKLQKKLWSRIPPTLKFPLFLIKSTPENFFLIFSDKQHFKNKTQCHPAPYHVAP